MAVFLVVLALAKLEHHLMTALRGRPCSMLLSRWLVAEVCWCVLARVCVFRRGLAQPHSYGHMAPKTDRDMEYRSGDGWEDMLGSSFRARNQAGGRGCREEKAGHRRLSYHSPESLGDRNQTCPPAHFPRRGDHSTEAGQTNGHGPRDNGNKPEIGHLSQHSKRPMTELKGKTLAGGQVARSTGTEHSCESVAVFDDAVMPYVESRVQRRTSRGVGWQRGSKRLPRSQPRLSPARKG